MTSFIDGLLSVFRRKPKEPHLFDRAFSPCDHPLRPTLEERYLDLRAAMASGEASEISAILAPGFASVDVRGKEIGADQMIAAVLNLDIDRSKRQVATTIVNVEAHYDMARVLQHYSMMSPPDAPKSMPRKLQTLSADTWRQVDGKWLLSKTRTLEVEVIDAAGRHKYVKGQGIAPLARYPRFVTARMWEYIEPIARGDRYEDPVEAFLERNVLGEIDGGGTQMGETPKIEFVDVTFWLRDSQDAIDAVVAELNRLGAPIGSELQFQDRGRAVTVPFGSTECVALFLDGVSLPSEVYKQTGADDLRQRLEIALKGAGEFRAYWHGNRESGLFFNGDNAQQMADAMMPVLTREPLCQNARLVVRYGRHPAGSTETRIPML
jgi:hypothetical protein